MALRPYGNEIILMIKGSAVVALITVYDLMGETRLAYSAPSISRPISGRRSSISILVEALRHAIEWIERRITIHLQSLTPTC